jgi:hypothetical protein
MFFQFVLTIVALLLGVGDLTALATVLSWQDQAHASPLQRQRWLTRGLPVAGLLLIFLLGLVVGVMVIWSPQVADQLTAGL